MLRRIADVLDVPISDFYRREAASLGDRPSAAECEVLLTTFLRIEDADARSRIIKLIRDHSTA
ncbi:hypothetical protein [uncultured Methylobacterium sp.]|uniref:hypothetical protein n=1 Tax=uncultured Methylobacterium sp. TaxID=157278 RepID=UPI0035CBC43E